MEREACEQVKEEQRREEVAGLASGKTRKRMRRKRPIDDMRTVIERLNARPQAETCLLPHDADDEIYWEEIIAKTERDEYANMEEFVRDVRKVLDLALQRYLPGSLQYQNTVDVADAFEKLVGGKRGKRREIATSKAEKPLSRKQKETLAGDIAKLDASYLAHIVQLVHPHRLPSLHHRFDFDLNALPPDTCLSLRKYVRSCRKLRPSKAVIVLSSDSDSSHCEDNSG